MMSCITTEPYQSAVVQLQSISNGNENLHALPFSTWRITFKDNLVLK